MVKLRPYFYPILLMVLAFILTLLFWFSYFPDPIIHIFIDLGNVVFILGILVVFFWIIIIIANRSHDLEIRQLIRDAGDEKRRFLRRLDHELKNPLTAIRAGLANLAETNLEEVQRQALSSVEAQTLRLSRLSSDLRKLAELEARPLERSEVNVNEILQEAFNLALDQPGAAERELKLTVPHAPWPLPAIQGDRDLLFLAVHNLLDNAIKFTQPGNTIEIRGFEDGSSLVVEVADTGQGIPDEEIPHIGEELYRAKSARGIPGNGLGLALVHSIVALHGGKVSLRSREGKGTVVSLRIPINQ
jgi:two-component system OmpR family sensor kinase